MFKGKVYSYSNINGKEKKFEREFNDINEYNNFINSNSEFSTLNNGIVFDSLFDFNRYLEDFFDSRYVLEEPKNNNKVLGTVSNNFKNPNNIIEGVDINKYEEELQKIELEKEEKKKKKGILESSLEKLKSYLEKFKEEKREDLVKKIEEDIKKIEKDLSELLKK